MHGYHIALPRAQRGVTLVEAVATIAVMSSTMMLATSMSKGYSDDMYAASTAQQIRAVGEASRAYINANQAALSAVADATTPAIVTVATLIAGNYLPSGYSATNNRGQTMCLMVLEPTANNLQGMVITHGGTALDDGSLRQISSYIGASGGSILSGATTTLAGTQGGWSTAIGGYGASNCAGAAIASNAGPGAGHNVMALWVGGNDVATAFLYRDAVGGRPELNRLNVNLDLGGHRITGVQTATSNGGCATAGDLAVEAGTGKVLSCQSGVWKSQGSAFWEDSVATIGGLPVCNASRLGQTRVARTPTTGTGPRAYTCDGTLWLPLAANDAGQLTLAGALTVASGGATITGATTVTGNVAVTGDATFTGTILPGSVTSGAVCTQAGAIARDASNNLLVCR